MGIKPNTLFPTKTVAPSASYPAGSAQNVTTPGDGTGTPWDYRVINDIWGFLQALVDAAGITLSGAPDAVGASDYLDALLSSGIIGDAAISGVSLSKLESGDASIQTGADKLRLSESRMYFESETGGGGDGSKIELNNGDSGGNAIEHFSAASGQTNLVNSNGFEAQAGAGAVYQLNTTVQGKGITYQGSPYPGGGEALLRRTTYDASALSWGSDPSGATIWGSNTAVNITMTGIPYSVALNVPSAQLTWQDSVTGELYSSPASLIIINAGGVASIYNIRVVSTAAPDATNMTDQLIHILYGAGAVN